MTLSNISVVYFETPVLIVQLFWLLCRFLDAIEHLYIISYTHLAFLILTRFIRLWAGPCGGLYSDTSRRMVVLHSHSHLFLHRQSSCLFDRRKRRIADWECRRPRQSDGNKIWNYSRWQHDGLLQGQYNTCRHVKYYLQNNNLSLGLFFRFFFHSRKQLITKIVLSLIWSHKNKFLDS